MARVAEKMAEDPAFGYSQKPPSGRWGPDFDCSSFIFFIANAVGYSVGIGKDKVRFTGTMLEEFKKAGFQLLPFANVGLGELEVGDILLNLALHAEVYVGEGQVVGAQSSETGGYVGKAGDQTGEEIKKQPVYVHDQGWDYVLRPPSEAKEKEMGYPDLEEPEDEGEDEMPYPYPNTTVGSNGWMPPYMNRGTSPMGYSSNIPMNNYPMSNIGGYPQGNLGQMNGYSQANAGYQQPNQMGYGPQGQYGNQQGWPQGQLARAKDLNEARDIHVAPGETVPVLLEDGQHLVLKTADQQGFPTMRVYKECSEEMPQHNPWGMGDGSQQMPMMQQSQGMVSREEFDQLKEMISNVQSAISAAGYPQGNGSMDSKANATAKQSGNGSGNSNRSNRNS